MAVKPLPPNPAPKPSQTALAQAAPCAVQFWTFAVPVVLGTLAGGGVGLLAKRYFNGDPKSTQATAQFAARTGAFWLVAGLTWIYMAKRNNGKAATT